MIQRTHESYGLLLPSQSVSISQCPANVTYFIGYKLYTPVHRQYALLPFLFGYSKVKYIQIKIAYIFKIRYNLRSVFLRVHTMLPEYAARTCANPHYIHVSVKCTCAYNVSFISCSYVCRFAIFTC